VAGCSATSGANGVGAGRSGAEEQAAKLSAKAAARETATKGRARERGAKRCDLSGELGFTGVSPSLGGDWRSRGG